MLGLDRRVTAHSGRLGGGGEDVRGLRGEPDLPDRIAGLPERLGNLGSCLIERHPVLDEELSRWTALLDHTDDQVLGTELTVIGAVHLDAGERERGFASLSDPYAQLALQPRDVEAGAALRFLVSAL